MVQFGLHRFSLIAPRFLETGGKEDRSLDPFFRAFPNDGKRAVVGNEDDSEINGAGDCRNGGVCLQAVDLICRGVDGIDDPGESLIDQCHKKEFPRFHLLRHTDNGDGRGIEDRVKSGYQSIGVVHGCSFFRMGTGSVCVSFPALSVSSSSDPRNHLSGWYHKLLHSRSTVSAPNF